MPSYYSVIRYHPDPVRGECVNIGVLAFWGTDVRWRFLCDWRRAEAFCGESLEWLKKWAGDGKHLEAMWYSETKIRSYFALADGWGSSSLQLGQIGGSLLSVQDLLEDVQKRYLVEKPCE